VEEKSQRILKNFEKGLTHPIKFDNLEKFAKTSLVAEVILDRAEEWPQRN
jgi:hypothetical protein